MPVPFGVENYLATFDGEARARLERIRILVKEEEPGAVEALAYGVVGYKLDGKPLVYFGGFPKHIGFYATPQGHEEFVDDLSKFKQGKGSVQFPLTQELPEDLIRRIVRFRATGIRETARALREDG